MNKKIITIFSTLLVIYGLITFLFAHVLVGLILLFLNFKKYNLKNWFLGFGIFYFVNIIAILLYYGLLKSQIIYNIIMIFITIIFFFLYFKYPFNKISEKKIIN